MAARTEQLLISRAVYLRQFHVLEKFRITDEYFEDEQSRQIYQFVRDYYLRGGRNDTIPADEAYVQRPHYNWQWQCQESVEALCDRLRLEKLRRDIRDKALRIGQEADLDPRAALEMFKEQAVTLSREHMQSEDLLFSSAKKEVEDYYYKVKNSNGIVGIPWPWDALNIETLGLQPTHYNVIYGRPKSGKTWIGCMTAAFAFTRGTDEPKERILFYSMEMRSIEIIIRLAVALAGVDSNHFRKGILDQVDPEGNYRFWRWFEYLKEIKEHPENYPHDPRVPRADMLATSDEEEGGGGITSLHAKIREFAPTLVIVDAFYLMGDDRSKKQGADWKVVTNVSRDLKRTAKQFDVPLIGICQGNRLTDKNPNNADLRELAYGDAIGQDADLVIRVDKKKDQDTSEREAILSLPGSRHSGTLDAFSIHFAPCKNMNQKNIISAADPSGPPSQGQQQTQQAAPAQHQGKGRPVAVLPRYANPNWKPGRP